MSINRGLIKSILFHTRKYYAAIKKNEVAITFLYT